VGSVPDAEREIVTRQGKPLLTIGTMLCIALASTSTGAKEPKAAPNLKSERMCHLIVVDRDVLYRNYPEDSGRYEWWSVPSVGWSRMQNLARPDSSKKDVSIDRRGEVWVFNSAKLVGVHTRIPDSLETSTPGLFSPPEPVDLAPLQMFREREFFEFNKAAKRPPQTIDSVKCDVSELRFGRTEVVLFCRQDNGKPFQLAIDSPYNHYALRFEVYETGLSVDSLLFSPPSGVVFKESEGEPR
jgi:hypothetical protein